MNISYLGCVKTTSKIMTFYPNSQYPPGPPVWQLIIMMIINIMIFSKSLYFIKNQDISKITIFISNHPFGNWHPIIVMIIEIILFPKSWHYIGNANRGLNLNISAPPSHCLLLSFRTLRLCPLPALHHMPLHIPIFVTCEKHNKE